MSLKLSSEISSSIGFVCIAIITTCYLLHQKKESTHSSQSSEKKNITSETTLSTTQFPWEPRSITNSQSKLSSSDSSHKAEEETTTISKRYSTTRKDNGKDDVHQQQLHFLSSMTFANSTLRQPSCPCCI